MTNNDILRRLRFTFDLSDSKMIEIFSHVNCVITRAKVSEWLKKEDDDNFQAIKDFEMANFLNGFIIENRGKKEGDDSVPQAEKKLNNNIIFVKIKIALNLQANDILEILDMVDFRLGKHELSAFFRKVGHKHFRVCKDQILRNFLTGVQLKYRPAE